tara:strand:+ start:671 stop:1384 length:714 start_codon:yes stop_codon:yes gene_type:complete
MFKLTHWDKNNWLSSRNYNLSLVNFVKSKILLSKNSLILDIGCGRANLISTFHSNLKLKKKPLGLDIIKHKDLKKNISFKKCDALNFLKTNKVKYNLILIKQTIHFFSKKKIDELLKYAKESLHDKGYLLILTLDNNKNELPSFSLMKKKLFKSLKNDKKIMKLIKKKLSNYKLFKFKYKVKIKKSIYISMIKNRYISCLLDIPKNNIKNGIKEINKKYEKIITFYDRLNCILFIKE